MPLPVAHGDRWQQVEAILDEVLELPEAAQGAFLDQHCADPELRAEVEALLEADREAGTFLEDPAAAYLPSLTEDLPTESAEDSVWIGRDVGPYRIQREVGSGGMGEVFEAFDSRLERTVALKRVQLRGAHEDSARRQRFRREARLAAGLSHPSIVRIHDILEDHGEDWLVMEYLEGRTLAQVLEAGPLGEEQALAWASQIAAGLAAAHERGIIHRDLKSRNVLITAGGEAKLLDFGLAKRVREALPEVQEATLTEQQQILGTLGAMSPEQARGQALDPRSDLFSLGSLLYEMVTGESPFGDANPAVTLTRICTYEPVAANAKNPGLSAATSDLIGKLLQKEPDLRPQTAKTVLETIHGQRRIRRPRSKGRRRALAALILSTPLVSAGWWFWHRTPPPPLYVAVVLPEVVGTETESSDPGATSLQETAENELVAAAVHAALQQGLSQLRGLAAVTGPRWEATSPSPAAAAQALGAGEALTARLTCLPSRCQLTLSRLAVGDGQVLGLAVFDVPKNNLAVLRTAVLSRLRQAYPGFRPRAGASADLSDEAYRRFLELSDAFQTHRPPSGEDLIRALHRLREDEPEFLEAYLLEANAAREIFYTSRDTAWLDHSLDRLRQASRLAPRDPRVPASLFDVASESERWDLAAEALEDLQELEPGGSEALQREAKLLVHQGDGTRALELMRAAADLQPAHYRLFNLALMEYQQGQVSSARQTLERLLLRDPTYHNARSLLAQLELLSGEPARAVELFEGLVNPQTAGSEDSNLGTAYLLAGRYEAAAARFRRAHEAQPANAILALNLADALQLTGGEAAAQVLYSQVLQLLEQDQELVRWQRLTVSAQALAHLGRPREAAAAVQEAGAIAADNPQVALESALVYTLIGDLNIALLHVEKARTMGLGPAWFRMPWFEPLNTLPAFQELMEPQDGLAARNG